jgi:hypothetical protein
MANYTYTITKGSLDQIWMTLNNAEFLTNNFTTIELNEILKPYRNFVHSLPGFQSTTATIVDSVTMEVTTVFDTLDHATNAMTQLTPPFEQDSIQDKLQKLLISKRQELGVTYTFTNRVE